MSDIIWAALIIAFSPGLFVIVFLLGSIIIVTIMEMPNNIKRWVDSRRKRTP